jgi:hypothetical protein
VDAKKLRELAESLFSKRSALMSLWQEQADNFYPERADFTIKRYLGTDFAANLTSSFPVLCRRDLGDQISTMLRPTAKSWFHMKPLDEGREDNDARRWLERAEARQRRAMYDPSAFFTRAMKEGDHDFATFGQYVLSSELNWASRTGPHLLYRTWHLRDCVWLENAVGEIAMVARRWKPTVQDLIRLFGSANVDDKVNQLNGQNRVLEEIDCMHIVCEAEMYDGKAGDKPRWSVYYDCQNDKVMQETAIYHRHYRVPRWQTVSGSQYAFSPATVVALPEARLIQSMAYTLLEAGEKMVNPPLVAQTDVIRSDVQNFPGGLTWADQEYDERLGPALRALAIDAKGMPIGIEQQRDSRSLLMQAFFLNKLRPFTPGDPKMTAFEAGQRVQDWIRQAMPLFEPMEMECNAGVCEDTFELLLRGGAFGSPLDMPRSLQGADIEFHFESPLHDAVEEAKGQKWLQGKALIADALALDKSVAALVDWRGSIRDVLSGIGFEAKWLHSERQVEDAARREQAAAAEQQLLAQVEQGASAAVDISAANKNFAEAGAVAR